MVRNPADEREAWPKWLPASVRPEDVPTITREELLARLAKQQIHVTDRELRYWEHEGILPQPVRKYHEGAMYAFYPAWHEEVVSEVASLRQKPRAERLSFAQLRPVSRLEFTQTCRKGQRRMADDWKRDHANASEHALKHPAVQDAIAEYLDNIGKPDGGLERHGLVKLAGIAAQVARAEALGIDPEALRLSDGEIDERQRTLIDAAYRAGNPAIVVARQPPASPPGSYKAARGILPWRPGDDLPEERIRRMRDGGRQHTLHLDDAGNVAGGAPDFEGDDGD